MLYTIFPIQLTFVAEFMIAIVYLFASINLPTVTFVYFVRLGFFDEFLVCQ